MSQYKKLKVQLASYERLAELTQAIQLVALSKLKIAQDQRKKENESLSSFKKLFSISSQIERDPTIHMHVLIPVTSDKSCCGSINTNCMDELFNYMVSLKEKNKDYLIFLVGKKGKTFLKKMCSSNYIKNVSNLSKETISLLTSMVVLEKLNTIKYDKCTIVFNHLYSVFEQGIVLYEVLSYDNFIKNILIQLNQGMDSIFWNSILENAQQDIFFVRDLYEFGLSLVLLKSFHENELSELGGRITAMQNASKNAQEIITKLKLQFNKARQAYITNELIEIVSCLNSLEIES